jgi:hypothetical protein
LSLFNTRRAAIPLLPEGDSPLAANLWFRLVEATMKPEPPPPFKAGETVLSDYWGHEGNRHRKVTQVTRAGVYRSGWKVWTNGEAYGIDSSWYRKTRAS